MKIRRSRVLPVQLLTIRTSDSLRKNEFKGPPISDHEHNNKNQVKNSDSTEHDHIQTSVVALIVLCLSVDVCAVCALCAFSYFS